MATTVHNRSPIGDITDLFSKGFPLLFGSEENSRTQFDPVDFSDAQALQNALFQRGHSTAQSDKVVEDILYRAQLAFAPILGEERSAGMYNTQTRTMLAREATARATAAASQAVLEDQQKSLAAATSIQNTNTSAKAQTANRSTNTKKPGQLKNILGSLGIAWAGGKAIKAGKPLVDSALEEIDNLVNAPSQEALDMSKAIGDEYATGLEDSLDPSTTTGLGATAGGFDPLADIDAAVGGDIGFDNAIMDGTLFGEELGGAAELADAGMDLAGFEDLPFEELDFGGFDFGDFGFADGGHVGSRLGYTAAANTARTTPRARPNIAQPTAKASATSAAKGRRAAAVGSGDSDVETGDTGVEGYSQPASPAAAKAMADLGISPMAAGLAMMSLAMGMPAVAANTLAKSHLISQLKEIISAQKSIATKEQDVVVDETIFGEDPQGLNSIAIDASVFGEEPGAYGDTPSLEGIDSTVHGEDPGSYGGGSADAAASAASDAASTGASVGGVGGSMGGDASSASDAASSSSDSSSSDSTGDGSNFADGGLIGGSAGLDRANVDGIQIMVQPDEYVIPEDVVEILGVDYFDKLLEAFHTPTALKQKKAR